MDKNPVNFILVLFTITASLSMGALGDNVDGGLSAPTDTSAAGEDSNRSTSSSPYRAPVILSHLNGSALNFWTDPTMNHPRILYPKWEILIWGSGGDPYTVDINGWISTGILEGNHTEILFNAELGQQYSAVISVGPMNWTIDRIIISNQALGGEDFIGGDKESLKFSQRDITWTGIKASIGATGLSIVSIWITWAIIRYRRMSRGVEHG